LVIISVTICSIRRMVCETMSAMVGFQRSTDLWWNLISFISSAAL